MPFHIMVPLRDRPLRFGDDLDKKAPGVALVRAPVLSRRASPCHYLPGSWQFPRDGRPIEHGSRRSNLMNAKAPLVVVGVDGSDESIEALRWAAAYAKSVGATVRAIKSWHYPWAMQTAPEQIDASVENQIKGELDDAVNKAGVDIEIERNVLEGHASLVLQTESATADLLVVGSRGHGAFHGMLLGSVSQHLAMNSVCPVVVVRPRTK
jgi:nucleotide-binding universal stress UspA family protein